MTRRTISIGMVFLLTICIIQSSIVLGCSYIVEENPGSDRVLSAEAYWPTDGWRFSTPEEQGMNPDIINEMNRTIYEEDYWFDSLIVVKNGYIVYEDYPSGDYNENTSHILHSATKSVSSMLIGTAIKEGFIEGVDTRILDFFPEKTFSNMSEEKENITLKHILTMTPGLEGDEWSFPYEGGKLKNDLMASLVAGDIMFLMPY